MRIGIYYRVSTEEQSYDSQISATEEWVTKEYPGVEVLRYYEKRSGRATNRKEYDRLIADTESGDIKLVVVYRLDRFGRSMNEITKRILRFDELGCGLRSVTQPFIDLRDESALGRMLVSIFSAMAQMERETIVARIKDGLRASKNKSGRKQTISQDKRDRVKALRAAGQSLREIARDTGVSLSRVQVITKENV